MLVSFSFFPFEIFWCTKCKFVLVLRTFFFLSTNFILIKYWILASIYWNVPKWLEIFSKWNRNTLDKISGVATEPHNQTGHRFHQNHPFNLIMALFKILPIFSSPFLSPKFTPSNGALEMKPNSEIGPNRKRTQVNCVKSLLQ